MTFLNGTWPLCYFYESPVLTLAGDHGDDDWGAGGGALDQHGEEDANHESNHRVGQEFTWTEDVACQKRLQLPKNNVYKLINRLISINWRR